MGRHDRAVYIYALTDPRTGDVRYIGSSVNPAERLMYHVARPTNPRMAEWVAELLGEGFRPGMTILEHCPNDAAAQAAERAHINQLGVGNLLNAIVNPVRASPDPDGTKIAQTFRLSDRAVSLIDRLADELGLSKTGVVELAVRRLAEIEGVVINDERLRDGDASPRQGGIPPPRL